MKKIIPIIVLLIGCLGLSVYISYDSSKTNQNFEQSWLIENKDNQQVEIYGTEQPIELKIINTINEKTKVTINGRLSKSSVDSVKESKLTATTLYVPISKHGFRLLTTPVGKDKLVITIELGKEAQLDEIFIDTVSGEVDVIIPKSFDGQYEVKLNDGAQLKEVPTTRKTSNSKIKIDAYGDVRIKKGD